MPIKTIFSQESVGFAIGYCSAFVVDTFFKASAMKYGYKTIKYTYKTINLVATKTKIVPPTSQVIFERVVDAVWSAY